MSKSKPSASISFPIEDRDERMRQWDELRDKLNTTRSGIVANMVKNGKVVTPEQMINLAGMATRTKNRQWVVFWVPRQETK